MITWLFPLLMAASVADGDSLQTTVPGADSLHVDTLREVTVRAGRHIPLPGMVINPNKQGEVLPPPSLGSILEKLSPGLNDKITHPFAIKQRKKERRRKRSLKALDDFSRVKTFEELLYEIYERQMREDSLERENSDQSGDNN